MSVTRADRIELSFPPAPAPSRAPAAVVVVTRLARMAL